jgi:hypothetical protein
MLSPLPGPSIDQTGHPPFRQFRDSREIQRFFGPIEAVEAVVIPAAAEVSASVYAGTIPILAPMSVISE